MHELWAGIALALVLVLAGEAVGQAETRELRPGDAWLDTAPLRSGTDSLALFVIDGEEAFAIGQYVVETTIRDGLIRRTDRMLGLAEELLWGEEMVIVDETLRPASLRSLGAGVVEVSFSEDELVRRGEEVEVRRDGPPGAFLGTALDLVIRSLPLEVGFDAVLVVLDADTLEEALLPIHVLREIAVSDANGVRRATWEVHVDLGGAVDVYHIDMETAALVRYESAVDSLVMLRW